MSDSYDKGLHSNQPSHNFQTGTQAWEGAMAAERMRREQPEWNRQQQGQQQHGRPGAGGGAHTQGGIHPWFAHFVLGLVFGGALAALFGLLTNGYGVASLIGLLAWGAAVMTAESQIEKHVGESKGAWFWQIFGGGITFAIVMMLTITPTCGWNSDKCSPGHNQHQTTQRR
jgi:hypothetical protein